MYIRKNIRPSFIVFGEVRAFDSFKSMGYEFNSSGFIRNDFSQLQETENTISFMRALSAMREYTEEHSNEGKTFEEIVALVRPRWCQLNGEVDRFEQYVIDNALDYYRKLKDETTKEGAIAKDVSDGLGIDRPTGDAVVK